MLPLPRRLPLLGAETFGFLDDLGEFLLEGEGRDGNLDLFYIFGGYGFLCGFSNVFFKKFLSACGSYQVKQIHWISSPLSEKKAGGSNKVNHLAGDDLHRSDYQQPV